MVIVGSYVSLPEGHIPVVPALPFHSIHCVQIMAWTAQNNWLHPLYDTISYYHIISYYIHYIHYIQLYIYTTIYHYTPLLHYILHYLHIHMLAWLLPAIAGDVPKEKLQSYVQLITRILTTTLRISLKWPKYCIVLKSVGSSTNGNMTFLRIVFF